MVQLGVHFEDVGLAVSDMNKFVDNLNTMGVTKVAATSLANFTQYEDVKSIIEQKQKKEDNFNLEIIPAVTCFFEDKEHTITLIAKDYEGYQSLCKIITESNLPGNIEENPNNMSNNKPIVYRDNLKKNVKLGHLYLTTGGKLGVFNNILGAGMASIENEFNDNKKILDNIYHSEHAGDISYFQAKEIVDYYDSQVLYKRPLKSKIQFAKQDFEMTGDDKKYKSLLEQQKLWEQAQIIKKQWKPLVKDLKAAMRPFNKNYRKNIEYLDKIMGSDMSELKSKAKNIYNFLESVFGKENIFFELQNHNDPLQGNPQMLIDFARMVGNDKFVYNNDTRIGVPYDSAELESELVRLDVARFVTEKKIIKRNDYDKEYAIKSEEKMRSDCSELLQDIDIDDKEDFINKVFKNTQELLDSCYIEKQEFREHYPKLAEDEDYEFERLCREAIPKKFPHGFSNEYEERLRYELNVIKTMGYSGYHLIVQDYLEYGRLLGYLDDAEIKNAPLSIEELDEYLTNTNNPRIGVGVGPGRGSAVGSLCCYLLDITDVDPIKNDLVFERFLNTERVSMPDIDSDFRPEVRNKCKDYVRAKYGEENVCEIVTKSYAGDNGAIRIAARYIGALECYNNPKLDETKTKSKWGFIGNELAKLLDNNECESISELKETKLTDTQKRVVEVAEHIMGMFTGYSKHAAGVIISKDCISDEMPLMWSSSSQTLQTQCQMASAEAKGYLKMDFLGLRNLAIISDIVKHPSDVKNITTVCQDPVLREKYIIENKEIYQKIFSTGLTQGIFQFESPGMQQMLKNFEPENFNDIVLLVASYRPGPLDYIPEMIARKWYEKDPSTYIERIKPMYPEEKYPNLYPVPQNSISLKNDSLKEILKDTYGCPIYQEQIMKIFQDMAGYSLGRADDVRRAMSKKKVEKLEKEKENFVFGNEKEIESAKAEVRAMIEKYNSSSMEERHTAEYMDLRKAVENYKIPAPIEGCIKKHGISQEEAEKLFEQMMPFAKYGFNKSHAAAYATVSMETAWLKLYRSADFFCSSLNNWKDRTDLPKFAKEMPSFGVKLHRPTLEGVHSDFIAKGNEVYYPIQKANNFPKSDLGVKPCNSVQGFMAKNPTITKSKIKTFIKLGCFDSCWQFSNKAQQNKEIVRTNNSKHEMLRWLDNNYDFFTKLRKEYNNLLKPNITPAEQERHQKAIRDLQGKISENVRNSDVVKLSPKEKFEERTWEYELLGHVFSLDKDLETIRQYNNKNDIHALESDIQVVIPIPCVVVSVGEQMKTKSSGKPYYPVTLMDRNGVQFERRFYDIPEKTCGIFQIQPNSVKYFCSHGNTVKDSSPRKSINPIKEKESEEAYEEVIDAQR